MGKEKKRGKEKIKKRKKNLRGEDGRGKEKTF